VSLGSASQGVVELLLRSDASLDSRARALERRVRTCLDGQSLSASRIRLPQCVSRCRLIDHRDHVAGLDALSFVHTHLGDAAGYLRRNG
jgi:hypothetical protein